MRIRIVIAVLLAAGLATAAVLFVLHPRDRPPPFLLGGIQVNEPDHDAWFRALELSGLNTVSTTVYAHQGDWDSDHLWWDDTDEGVVRELRGARRHGVRTVLIPRVALDHAFDRNLFLWHGLILPRDEPALESWFSQYETFVLQWAEIAEREQVDLFAIGSELSSLTSTVPVEAMPELVSYYLDTAKQAERRDATVAHRREILDRHLWARGKNNFDDLESFLDAETAAHRDWAMKTAYGAGDGAVVLIDARARWLDARWRALIAKVRTVYHGPLTYAANFDQYHRVGFWDALDLIGINAYFSLRPGTRERPLPGELEDALVAGWDGVLDGIESFRAANGLEDRGVVFTEIGYTFRSNSTVRPWAGAGLHVEMEDDDSRLFVWQDQPIDLDERATAIRALTAALDRPARRGLLRGVLYWKLSSIAAHRDIEPFVIILGGQPEDPALPAMRSLASGRTGPGELP